MSKTLLSFLICFLFVNASILQAQEFSIGLKGGVQKTFGGEITGTSWSLGFTETFEAEGEIGFHGGIWTQISFGKFFIRPEIVYSKLESRFDFPQVPSLYEVEELSVPVLIGYNIFGPIDIYAGAAYKYIMDATIERSEPIWPSTIPPQVDVQDIPLSAQIGAKVEFGRFGLDIRYDHSLSTKQGKDDLFFVFGNHNQNPPLYEAEFDDARLNQLIVSLTVKLWDSDNAEKKRRRGGNCYF